MDNKNLELLKKFINDNFEDNDTKAYDNLEKLISFILENNIIFGNEKEPLDIVYIEMLIENNDLFKNMVSIVCIPNNIEKLKSMNIKFVNSMIYAYEDYITSQKEEEESLDKFDLYASIDEMDPVTLYFRSLPSKILTKEEIAELYIKYENGDEDAFKEIIKYNLKLVVSVAKKYARKITTNSGIDFLDLIQAGNEGLITGAKKFDYKMGYKFSTYVRWWIRQAISRTIANESRLIRVPVHAHESLNKIKKFRYEFYKSNNRYPNKDEIANALNLDENTVFYYLNNMEEPLSLNSLIRCDDGDETEFMEFVPGFEDNLEDQAIRKNFNYALNNLSNLTPKELEVIKYRFGFYGRIYTLEEIGQIYGVTRERIRQIESKAKKKLQRCKEIKKFR